MDISALERVVKENSLGFEYELFLLRRKNLKISTENGEFEKISTAEDFGLALRLKKGKRVGFAYTSEVSPEAVKTLVESLKEITLLMPEDPYTDFKRKMEPSTAPSPLDKDTVSLPVEEKINKVISFERDLIKRHPYIVGTRETGFTESVFTVSFRNSFGVEFGYDGSAYSLVTSLLAESPRGDRNISWGFRAARYFEDLDLNDFAKELTYKLVETLDPRPCETRALTVVFHREAFASMLDVFAELFLGENALKGKTPLAGREGERIAPEGFSLIDDGMLERGFSTHPYDDEGSPQEKTPVVENGIFKTFLHSIKSANAFGVRPTGNGFRSSFTSPPSCGVSNFYLKPQKWSFEDLISSEGEVLVVVDLMGLHTADTISGDFSLGANGILYKNGEKVQAVRGVTVAGNFLKLLKNLSLIGNDLRFYGSVGSPSVSVKNITIGGI
jgi:PmbA protein